MVSRVDRECKYSTDKTDAWGGWSDGKRTWTEIFPYPLEGFHTFDPFVIAWAARVQCELTNWVNPGRYRDTITPHSPHGNH
jgi:hypothetical protein